MQQEFNNAAPDTRDAEGTLHWRKDGLLHREDGPAIERANGTKEWYRHGVRHRADGPAYEEAVGLRAWYQDGVYHRVGGPAIENTVGPGTWWHMDKIVGEDAAGDRHWYEYDCATGKTAPPSKTPMARRNGIIRANR